MIALDSYSKIMSDIYWSNQLQNYYNNKLKLNAPTFELLLKKQLFGIDYALLFMDKTLPQMNLINLDTGLTLLSSTNPNALILGQNLVLDAILSQSTDLTELSDLTGENINYGQQFLNAGMLLGNQLASSLGGLAGLTVSKAIGAAGSIGNSISKLRALNAASKSGVLGLGKAKLGNAMAIAGAVSDLTTSFLPEKTEYDGSKGDITRTMDSVYDGISDAAMSFGPIGMIVGGAMKGANFLGKGLNALGGGTDSMTTTDAILGSSLLNLTPIGLINGFGGLRAETITKDDDAFSTVGASYTGSNWTVDSALQKSGKKYGLFSDDAREKANMEILEARRLQALIADIANESRNRSAIRHSMSAINGNRRALAMQGGYNQAAIRAGKHGMIILAKRIVSQYNLFKRKEKFQKGGILRNSFEAFLKTLPYNLQDTTNYRMRDYWEFYGKPRDFEEGISKKMFIQQDDGWHAYSVAMNPSTGEIEFMKSVNHPTHKMELDWYYSDNAIEFRKEWDLVKSDPYWKYVRKKEIQEFGEGGSILLAAEPVELFKEGGTIETTSFIMAAEPEDEIQEYKEGGSFNVIPEGALHARLHHMENAENITKKGIPVVSEEQNGEIELLAEIEREELILRLEVTKKLEELAKDGSDEAAIEAGKLLVEEILNNTIDNTNKLL